MSQSFQIGEEASRGKLVDQLTQVRVQGETVLTQIDQQRVETLVTFERRLSALNGRRQQANRVMAPRVAARFVVSDFLDLDQAQTTATVRADVQAVTLRERDVPAQAIVRSKRFSVDTGTSEAMSTDGSLYRAYSDSSTVPTGTFDLELTDPLPLTLLVCDLAAMPSEPTITVSVSSTGTTYVPAQQTQVNGYRLTAWLAPMVVRFIRITLAPSHPDTLGGRSYTFGLTSFAGSTMTFQLQSELVTRPTVFRPHTTQVRLVAPDDPGLTYFLAFNDQGFIEVQPNHTLDVPGVTAAVDVSVELDTDTGRLVRSSVPYTLPASAYLETVQCVQNGSTDVIRVAPGLEPSLRDALLTHKYLGVGPAGVYYVRNNVSVDAGTTFTVSYLTGPSTVRVQLKVQLTTTDRTITPVFRGAALEEI